MQSPIAPFAAVAMAMIVSPGLGFVVFSNTILTQGRRAAGALLGGMMLGTAALGAAVIAAYPLLLGWQHTTTLQSLLRLVGGSYLLYAGLRMLTAPFRATAALEQPAGSPRSDVEVAARGIVTELSNPSLL